MVTLLSNLTIGQSTFRGKVIDSSSSEGLPFVDVCLIYDTNQIKTKTDFDGIFNFEEEIPNNFKVTLSYVGYFDVDTIVKQFNFNNNLNLFMNPDTTLTITFPMRNKEGAIADIEKGEIKLFLPGGLIGAPRLANDSTFQDKYQLQFIFLGCTRWPSDNFEEYNKETFKYLDKKYGNEWRKEIRNDVIGY